MSRSVGFHFPVGLAQDPDRFSVARVLSEHDAYPPSARQALINGLPFLVASKRHGGGGHAFQDEVRAMVQDALSDASRLAAERQSGHSSRVKDAEVTLEEIKESRGETATLEKDASECIDEKATVLEEARASAKRARYEYEVCKERHAPVDEEHSDHCKVRDHVRSLRDGPFTALADGTSDCEDESFKDEAIQLLMQFAQENTKVEPALRPAIPAALGTDLDKRRPFDIRTVEAVRKFLEKSIESAEEAVVDSGPAAEEASYEVMGEWAIADVARERELAASDALKQAKIEHRAAAKAASQAASSVEKHQRLLGNVVAEISNVDENASRIADAIEAFERLMSQATEVNDKNADAFPEDA